MRSRKKKRGTPWLALLLLAMLLGLLIYFAVRRWGPSSERVGEEELFGVSGDETAIMYQYELQKAKALSRDGEVYLPVEWVQTILNKRFYWDEEEGLLLYVLPDRIVRMTVESRGESGRLLCFFAEEKLWLSTELIRTYTDVRMELFQDGAAKRVFVSVGEDSDLVAESRGRTVLRSGPSLKRAVVREVEKGEALRCIPDHPNAATNERRWRRVMTDDGFTGYMRLKKLFAPQERPVANDFQAPVYGTASLGKAVLLGWHQVSAESANLRIDQVTEGAAGLNVISPTWFSLRGNQGDYQSIASRAYVEAAHAKGLQVWALIDNFDGSVTLGEMLRRTSVREKLISQLMADAGRYGFDGINIDFELLRKDAVRQYLEFIRELSVACRERGLFLSVDVPNPASYNSHYDRGELAVFCDYVINMGYDEHTRGDDMGSSSSIGFFTAGIEDSLREVPREKLVAGVPFYTRLWKKGGDGSLSSEAMTMGASADWVEKYQIKPEWDEDSGQYIGERVADDGSIQRVWLEEERSMALKMGAVRENDLAGAACWRLGIEKKEIWEIMSHEQAAE